MVISKATANKIIECMSNYIDDEDWPKIIDELKTIPGNVSYRSSVQLLETIRSQKQNDISKPT